MIGTPTALILDFGGVLTTDLWASVRAAARREGLREDALLNLLHRDPRIHAEFIQLERGGISQIDFEAQLANAAGIAPSGLLRRMCADLRPNHAMLTAVAKLRDRAVRIGVLSNTWGTGYFSPYAGYDLENRVDALVFSDQERMRKPEPAIFDLMLDRLGAQAADTVFVDDVEANLPPAQAMGMITIHHTETLVTLARLQSIFDTDLNLVTPGGSGERPNI